MRDPGRLNQRVMLEVPVETPDGLGGVIRSLAAGPLVWASVVPVSARRDVITVTHRITVRARHAITTRHRLRKGARRFDIVAVRDADASGRFLLIEAHERRD